MEYEYFNIYSARPVIMTLKYKYLRLAEEFGDVVALLYERDGFPFLGTERVFPMSANLLEFLLKGFRERERKGHRDLARGSRHQLEKAIRAIREKESVIPCSPPTCA
jgi:hypothetical protein